MKDELLSLNLSLSASQDDIAREGERLKQGRLVYSDRAAMWEGILQRQQRTLATGEVSEKPPPFTVSEAEQIARHDAILGLMDEYAKCSPAEDTHGAQRQ